VRRLAVALTVAALPLAGGVALADTDEPRVKDNVATAVVEEDGATAFDFEWEVRRLRHGDVDHQNVARAAARCTDCRATAIAFQIVLAQGDDVGAVTPRNAAVAINDQCTSCVVYAGARQFVRVVDRPVRFTGEGLSTLASVRSALRALEGQNLSADELKAAVEAQEARVIDVLTDEIVPRGDETAEERVRDEDDLSDDDS
jgi:putative peptide zinc metalloprotease protein